MTLSSRETADEIRETWVRTPSFIMGHLVPGADLSRSTSSLSKLRVGINSTSTERWEVRPPVFVERVRWVTPELSALWLGTWRNDISPSLSSTMPPECIVGISRCSPPVLARGPSDKHSTRLHYTPPFAVLTTDGFDTLSPAGTT